MATDPSVPAPRRVGGFDRGGQAWVLALFMTGGAGLGALLPLLARWASGLPWVPFQGPLELLSSFDSAWLVWGRPLLGLLAGLGLAAWVLADSPVLEIGPDAVEVRRRGEVERVIPRAKIDAVYRRRGAVVIEGVHGQTLFDADVEGAREAVRDAFVAAGYPWEGARG